MTKMTAAAPRTAYEDLGQGEPVLLFLPGWVSDHTQVDPTARLEIAVDVEFQQYRRMIRWPAICFGINPAETKLGEIELVNEDIDHASRIVLVDPVRHSGNSVDCPRSAPATKRFVRSPANRQGNHIRRAVFTQPGSTAPVWVTSLDKCRRNSRRFSRLSRSLCPYAPAITGDNS